MRTIAHLLRRLEAWFNAKYSWFFTNGMKQQQRRQFELERMERERTGQS